MDPGFSIQNFKLKKKIKTLNKIGQRLGFKTRSASSQVNLNRNDILNSNVLCLWNNIQQNFISFFMTFVVNIKFVINFSILKLLRKIIIPLLRFNFFHGLFKSDELQYNNKTIRLDYKKFLNCRPFIYIQISNLRHV